MRDVDNWKSIDSTDDARRPCTRALRGHLNSRPHISARKNVSGEASYPFRRMDNSCNRNHYSQRLVVSRLIIHSIRPNDFLAFGHKPIATMAPFLETGPPALPWPPGAADAWGLSSKCRMILFALAENGFDGIHENYFGMRHTVTHYLTRPLLHRRNIDERIAKGAIVVAAQPD